MFLAKNIADLLEHTGIKDYTIEVEKDKQSFFIPIKSLELLELETVKTYIK